MSSESTALVVNKVSKCYGVYDKPIDRVKYYFLPRLRNVLGLGERQYRKDFWSLNDVSFDVNKGETLGIVGRNGAGKSTLLQIICGTVSQTSGDVKLSGKVAALLELGAGFNPEFTGRENVYMNAALYGLNKKQVDQKLNDIFEFAEIGDYVDQPVKTYSSGMYVRLAFAVIANVDAEVLIIDEALAVGDMMFVQKCMRFIRSFMKTGTVIFVSHDTNAVSNLCDKVIWLNKGEVAAYGEPKEVIEKYLAALYGQTISENSRSEDDKQKTGTKELPRDMRQDFINASSYRNDIELFHFDDEFSHFGTGGAEIRSVEIKDEKGKPLAWVVGGESIIVEIVCFARTDIVNPIIGFIVKDKRGQVLFGENTYYCLHGKDTNVSKEQTMNARFSFRLPYLPEGDYSISAAIAEGSQLSHIQHHWVNDALIMKVHASATCFGLIGLPMKDIQLEVK